MGDHRQAIVTYDGLPISSGGAHGIRRKDRKAIWRQMSRFLGMFTTYSEPEETRLVLFEGKRVDHQFFEQAYRLVANRFGRGERRSWLSGPEGEEDQLIWRVSGDNIDGSLDLMQELDPFSDRLGGPLFLGVRATFLLCDPDTGAVFPGQGSELYGGQEADRTLPLGVSVMYLRLANPSTCALFLSLPFPSVTRQVTEYAARLDASLPFRLSPKHWARWQLNAQGTRYYKRRIGVLTAR